MRFIRTDKFIWPAHGLNIKAFFIEKGFNLLIFFVIFLSSNQASAQIPYFQQEVNYTIEVRLDDKQHALFATEKINYRNNSPNVLTEIYFHLWPNAYKNNETAFAQQLLQQGNTDFYFSTPEQRGYIDQLDFKVNDLPVKWAFDSIHIDICKLQLNQPLQPGEKINISTPFHIKIPDSRFSRLGHEEQSYQITQWYPKPAVYDARGWHAIPYLNQGEFYSEFGSFDVFITLPDNYVLAATGDRQDADTENSFLEKKVEETKMLTTYSTDLSFPLSSEKTKTVHFHQNKVHDFAWFADKRYHVMKSSVKLPLSNHEVTTWTYFTNSKPELWANAINSVNKAIVSYSQWVGDYPYQAATAVEGALSAGGGMEYPNITVIGPTENALELDAVIAHEVGHNWFYGILGSNERSNPWMDEGMNTMYEMRYMQKYHPGTNIMMGHGWLDTFLGLNTLTHKQLQLYSYLVNARRGLDQAINLPSEQYTTLNYGGMVYAKTGLALDYLKSYLGEALFDSCMHNYYRTWQFRHPQPEDFQKIMEACTGKKTDWFYTGLLQSTKKINYKICNLKKDSATNSFHLLLNNKENLAGPFMVAGMKDKKVQFYKWYEGFENKKTIDFPSGTYDAIQIDPEGAIPQLSRQGTTIQTNGVFKKFTPLKLKFLAGVEDPDKNQLFYTPVLGFNNYDKLMPGLAIYNSLFPSKPFEYILVPMIGLGSGKFAGTGNVNYNFYPSEGALQHIQPGISALQYEYSGVPLRVQKLAPFINITFRNKNATSHTYHKIAARGIFLNQQEEVYDLNIATHPKSIEGVWRVFQDLLYEIKNEYVLHPTQLLVNVQHGKEFLKTSLEGRVKIPYKGKNRSFDIRLFAGGFFYNTLGSVPFRMSSWRGKDDYLFDATYLGRTENDGLFSQQMTIKEGGFKVPLFLGNSTKWLAAINFSSAIPGRLPLSVFADIGTSGSLLPGNAGSAFLYDTGIQLTIIPKILSIYFPIFIADEIQRVLDLNSITYLQTIRFECNLNQINPFSYIRNIR
jgi:hypothetical protein